MAPSSRKPTWPRGMPRRPNTNYDRKLQLRGDPNTKGSLPLVHVTSAWASMEVVRGKKFETRKCDVFQRELLYFFVLRPAYRSRYGSEETHQISRFPVVFVLKADAVPAPLHVYPFDTGGAAKGAFASQADKYVPLEDYALSPTHDAAAAHIEWAFSGTAGYFEGQLRGDILDDVKPFESVVSGFIDVARMGREGSNLHDKRASTVEVAASHDVQLKDNVLFTIIPKQYLEGNGELVDAIAELGSEHTTYDWQPNKSPDDFQAEIMDITRRWLLKKKII